MQKHAECSGETSGVSRYPALHCVGENLSTPRIQQEEFENPKQFTSTNRESQVTLRRKATKKSSIACLSPRTHPPRCWTIQPCLSWESVRHGRRFRSEGTLRQQLSTISVQPDGKFSNPFAQPFRFLEELIGHHDILRRCAEWFFERYR